MKRYRFTFTLIAFLMLIGVGVYAMRGNNHANTFDTQVWDYNGNPGGEDTASYYSLSTGTPNHTTCGLFSTTICQITAEADANDPSIPDLNGENPMAHQAQFEATLRGNN